MSLQDKGHIRYHQWMFENILKKMFTPLESNSALSPENPAIMETRNINELKNS